MNQDRLALGRAIVLLMIGIVLQTTLLARLQVFGFAPNLIVVLVILSGRWVDARAALLLGFTLAMVIGGWDTRRNVLIAESNAIGTLSLRAGLFEQPIRGDLRMLLHEYADARIFMASAGGDPGQFRVARQKSEELQPEIWSTVERAGTLETSPAKLSSLISAANELIDE